jgi:hypothetical protein
MVSVLKAYLSTYVSYMYDAMTTSEFNSAFMCGLL